MLRPDLTVKGRVFLFLGTLCIGFAAAGTALAVPGPHADVMHFARGVLYGLGLTLNIASWRIGRMPPRDVG